MSKAETVKVDNRLLDKIKQAVDAALSYEKATKGTRKLGITGEVGELLACHQLGLELIIDSRSEGFDAIDKDGLRVEIKTRRSESDGLPSDAGRTSRFSEHKFDYAILVLLNRQYEISEIWRAEYTDIRPIIDAQKRRNPNLSSFKRAGRKIFSLA
ncbi:MAG: hypothetical protein U9Q97_10800 [Acidobacteriota bacterium]|nr:hypothetical protein [Acidobacteriota bacterium]